jgi:N-acetylglucosamine-6-sulfatase
VLSAVALALAATESAAGQQPNLIFVLTDDQRLETIEMMPETRAAFGVEFTQFVVTTPTCCPSRASFLTGRWAHATGVQTTTRAGYEAFKLLEPESLGPWLQEQGYVTGFVGKYFNHYNRSDPVPPGWDEYYGRLYGQDRGNGSTRFGLREFRRELGAVVQNEVVGYPNDDVPDAYATRVFGAKAEAFIRRATDPALNPGGKPFALLLWTIGVNTPLPEDVHAEAPLPPWEQPLSFLEADMSDKPALIRRLAKATAEQADAVRATQLRQSITIDDVVGDLVDLIEELGLRGSTWGIFSSDNGRFWGEHGLLGKVFAYEESARVPFRMMSPTGERFAVDSLAANVDVAPTIMALAGDDSGRDYGGRSLLPLLADPSTPWRSNVLIEIFSTPYCAFRGERWKYVQYLTGDEELYDLADDPFELDSLHRVRPSVLIRYRGLVRRSACDPPGFEPLPTCTQEGTRRDDRIRGTRLPDWICAGGGDDVIRVRGGGRDVVKCGPGRDVVHADRTDRLRGCEGVSLRR